MDQPIIHLKNITARIRDRWIFEGTSWMIMPGENWVVLGPNGSGKSTLVKVLTGDIPCVAGGVSRFLADSKGTGLIGYVSFEQTQRILEADKDLDWARYFSNRSDNVTAVKDIFEKDGLTEISQFYFEDLGIFALLDRPIRALSNGELRKVLLARVLAKKPSLLILDEPFDGLDRQSSEHLKALLLSLITKGQQIVLVTHRVEEIPNGISHAICLRDCRVVYQGSLSDALSWGRKNRLYDIGDVPGPVQTKVEHRAAPDASFSQSIIDMKNVTVSYGDKQVINHLTWTVREGEHWAVTGPNGSGKTTLMGLICADHPQGYANDIRLFGKRRGSGESIWEIKHHIGVVTPEFQVRYHRLVMAQDAVLSGFYDSVGLYQTHTLKEAEAAMEIMKLMGIYRLKSHPMNRLSYGEQRMVLLARAMVKHPKLLILDEPCQGLDPANRRMLLDLISRIGREERTQLIFITHHFEEIPNCITHRLVLERNDF
mgnify:CR=1 FL=1